MNNSVIIYSLLIKHKKVTKAMHEAIKFGMNKKSFIETRNKYGINNWKKSRAKYLNSNRAEDESETELDDKAEYDKKNIFPHSPYSPCNPTWTWSWNWKDERKDSGISEIIMNNEDEDEDESGYIHSLPLDKNDNDNDSHNYNHNYNYNLDDDEYVFNIDKANNNDNDIWDNNFL